MKIILLLIGFIAISSTMVAQNVGIGITTPLAPLHIKKDNEALRIEGSSSYIGFYNNGGTGPLPMSFIQSAGNNLYLGTDNATGLTQFYSNGTPLMTIAPTGNVGIGTIIPTSRLTVQTPNNTTGFTHVSEGGITLIEAIGGVSATIGTSSNHTFRLMANNNPIINLDALGNVGVGLIDQTYKMDISDRIRIRSGSGSSTAGIWFNNPSNSTAISFIGTKDVDQVGMYGNSGGWSLVMNTNNGNIGIGSGVPNPTNKLQIGSVGSTGFAGNDLVIGNGTNALGIFQSNASTYIGATTDIVLMPRNNGHGRVGINTTSPRASLDVIDFVSVAASYAYFNRGGYPNGVLDCNGCSSAASIIVSNAILANEFDAYSDARIKNINGISTSAKDLEIINALQISDYTMKDIVKYGTRPFKKVIAQEVEKVYPQVVSQHTDFIPNVYQLATKVEKVANGLMLSFTNNHSISSNAKKLRVLSEEKGVVQEFEIVSIPSAKQVVIKSNELNISMLFVYGEEVNDFRTVDYEGLTTLNISATQELSKLIKGQQAAIDAMKVMIASLTEEIKELKEKNYARLQ